MKFSNIKIFILIVVFVLIGLSCFILEDISQKIVYENSSYKNIEDIYLLNDYHVNVKINHCCDGSYYLVEIANVGNNSYYLYSSSITDKLYVLYMNKSNYNTIINKKEIENLIGTVRVIDDSILKNIINNNTHNFYLSDSKSLTDLLEKNIFIDTVNIDYKNSLIYDILFYINFFVSILGILICIFLLIIKNKQNIKVFIKKHTITKLLFILSFIPYLVCIILAICSSFSGISFFYDTMYGLEAFNFTILIILFFLYPLYIIIFIYQLIYIIYLLIKRKNKKQ